jgi:hypothetical protein
MVQKAVCAKLSLRNDFANNRFNNNLESIAEVWICPYWS